MRLRHDEELTQALLDYADGGDLDELAKAIEQARMFRWFVRPLRRTPVLGIELRDWPMLIRIRLTACRRNGHWMTETSSYCLMCGAPWRRLRGD